MLRVRITGDTNVHIITTRESSSESKKKLAGGQTNSQNGQVVAALGPHFHCHALVVTCHQSVQEAPGLTSEALFPFINGAPALNGLGAVSTKADLSDHALK